MGSRRGGNILMALGVVLALIGGGLSFVMTQNAVGNAQRTEVKTGPVIVAKEDLPLGTIITSAKVQELQWPEGSIPPGTATKMEDLEGKFTKVRIVQRSPINVSEIAGKDLPKVAIQPAPAGQPPVKVPTTVDPEFLLEKGQVLVAVDYPSAGAMIRAGAIKAGARVDIIVKTPGATSEQIAPIFRNIQIRGIGSVNPDGAGSGTGTTLIFAVEPQQALELKFLESMNPDLMLRAAGDSDIRSTDLVTQDYILNKYRLQRPSGGGVTVPAPAPPRGT